MRVAYLLAVPLLATTGLVAAPGAAVADCTSTGGTTICSQGDSRGADTGGGPSGSSGPWVPYPCEYDYYYCDDVYGWGIDLDVDMNRPDRPQVNPQPADRPNVGGGDRGGGDRGGGGRGGGGRR